MAHIDFIPRAYIESTVFRSSEHDEPLIRKHELKHKWDGVESRIVVVFNSEAIQQRDEEDTPSEPCPFLSRPVKTESGRRKEFQKFLSSIRFHKLPLVVNGTTRIDLSLRYPLSKPPAKMRRLRQYRTNTVGRQSRFESVAWAMEMSVQRDLGIVALPVYAENPVSSTEESRDSSIEVIDNSQAATEDSNDAQNAVEADDALPDAIEDTVDLQDTVGVDEDLPDAIEGDGDLPDTFELVQRVDTTQRDAMDQVPQSSDKPGDTDIFICHARKAKLSLDVPHLAKLEQLTTSDDHSEPPFFRRLQMRLLLFEHYPLGTILHVMKRPDPLPEGWRHWPFQIALGLAYLHFNGIAHGHLNLSTIVIDVRGRASLAYFNGVESNTVGWQAPESLHKCLDSMTTKGKQLCDVWSLGKVLQTLIDYQNWAEDVQFLVEPTIAASEGDVNKRKDLSEVLRMLKVE